MFHVEHWEWVCTTHLLGWTRSTASLSWVECSRDVPLRVRQIASMHYAQLCRPRNL